MADPALHRPVAVTSLKTGESIEECAACLDAWPCAAVLGDVTDPEHVTVRIGETWVTVGPAWCVTRFPDGTEVHAHPSHTDEQAGAARALGYSHVGEMTRDHDLLHSVIAEARGLPYSPVLWALAHGEPAPEGADDEERLVLLAQRLVRWDPTHPLTGLYPGA
jgi:hypothetical protein